MQYHTPGFDCRVIECVAQFTSRRALQSPIITQPTSIPSTSACLDSSTAPFRFVSTIRRVISRVDWKRINGISGCNIRRLLHPNLPPSTPTIRVLPLYINDQPSEGYRLPRHMLHHPLAHSPSRVPCPPFKTFG